MVTLMENEGINISIIFWEKQMLASERTYIESVTHVCEDEGSDNDELFKIYPTCKSDLWYKHHVVVSSEEPREYNI